MKYLRLFSLLIFCFTISINDSFSQRVKKSQKAAVEQTLAKTEISISYYRPVARGRELFGSLVKYDKVWQPGANNATVIEFDRDLEVEGKVIEAGKYSLWAIPGKEKWVFIFSKSWDAWHTEYPEGEDALRVEITPQEGMHMEVLSYYFPYVEGTEATLHFHWGKTMVPIQIKQAK